MTLIHVNIGDKWVGKSISPAQYDKLEDKTGYEPYMWSSYTKKRLVTEKDYCHECGHTSYIKRIVKPMPRKNAKITKYRKLIKKKYYIPIYK